jgi:hypothetical protein
MPRISATPANNSYKSTPKMVETGESGYGRQELTYSPVQMSPTQGNGRTLNNQNTTHASYQKNR